jgi:hypothetical protein
LRWGPELGAEGRTTLLHRLDPEGDGRHNRKRLDALEAVDLARWLARPTRNRPLERRFLLP